MKLTLYQVDAFASRTFTGNSAAICPLQQWIPDALMQAIAMENNLSETAFYVPQDDGFHLRWFTPLSEVDLCGHATLACAYVLFNVLDYNKETIKFYTKSGQLNVMRNDDWFVMDFPAQPPQRCDPPQALVKAFTSSAVSCLKSEDYILVFDREDQIKTAKPDLSYLKQLDLRGVCITAKADQYDFVTRFFAPKYGIDEDPVTGSAYTQLVPYWCKELGKTTLSARQLSNRGGDVRCKLMGNRVSISGQAVLYLQGSINIPDN